MGHPRLIPILAAMAAIVAVMAYFCAMTPWVFDDFGYGAGPSSLADLWSAQLEEHRTWSGKFIGHFLSRCLLHGPAWLHPLWTPLMFACLVFCGVLLALGRQWRTHLRAWQLFALAGLTWFAVPAFGTVFFWRTGTPDYGYTLTFATAFLVPYRFWAEDGEFHPRGGPGYALAGLAAGWSNENLGMLAVLTACGVCIYRYRTQGRIPLWAAAGVAGALAGWCLLMSAPGNALRLAQLGGSAGIPIASAAAFNNFLLFWGSQQLELAPYFLASLWVLWILHRSGRLSWKASLPAGGFFLMSQAGLAAFLLSPSTPYRAMTATYFYAALSFFALTTALEPPGKAARRVFALFCCLLALSVAEQVRVFAAAQAVTEAKLRALRAGTAGIRTYEYPESNKYFFPGYDIREIDLYGAPHWRDLVPWNETRPLSVAGTDEIRALVSNNVIYFSNVPPGRIHVAFLAHEPTVAALVQGIARAGFTGAAQEIAGKNSLNPYYKSCSARVTDDGHAAAYARGIRSLEDIVYIGLARSDHAASGPFVWRRARF